MKLAALGDILVPNEWRWRATAQFKFLLHKKSWNSRWKRKKQHSFNFLMKYSNIFPDFWDCKFVAIYENSIAFRQALFSQCFSDDKPLNLRCSFIDLKYFGVTHKFLHRIFRIVSISAKHLHSIGSNFIGHIRREAFRYRHQSRSIRHIYEFWIKGTLEWLARHGRKWRWKTDYCP